MKIHVKGKLYLGAINFAYQDTTHLIFPTLKKKSVKSLQRYKIEFFSYAGRRLRNEHLSNK